MGSENEETLATHPDPSKERTRDKERSRQVTDVTDPIQSATYTMKLRANHILCVGVLVLLGLVLLSEQMKADDSDQVFQMRPDSDLLSEQMKDDDSDQVFQMRPDSDLPSEQMKDDDSEQVFQMRPDSDLLSEQMRDDDSEQVF